VTVASHGLVTGLSPSPAATRGSPTHACGLTALCLAPRLSAHGEQPEELMLEGPPRPDTVHGSWDGSPTAASGQDRRPPAQDPNPCSSSRRCPGTRQGTPCCSPTLPPPAQLPQALYLQAHCGFLFLTVLQSLLNLLKLLPSISALTPACCHPWHSSPRSQLSSAQAPVSLIPTALPLPSQLSLSSASAAHLVISRGNALLRSAPANSTSCTRPRMAVGLAM